MKIETKVAHFSSPLYLESGRILEPYEIAYETYGELNEEKSNVILVCHALSAVHIMLPVLMRVTEKQVGGMDSLVTENPSIRQNILLFVPMLWLPVLVLQVR